MKRRSLNETYDKDTGQVFVESVAEVRSMISEWIEKPRRSSERPKNYRHSRPGTSSLFDSAMRVLCWNIDGLYPETLEHLPWSIAKGIVNHLKETDGMTPKIWKVFRAAYPNDYMERYSRRILAKCGDRPIYIPSITDFLLSNSFNGLARLSITNLGLMPSDMYAIARIPKLEILAMTQYERSFLDDEFNDEAVRRWTRYVLEGNYLVNLRVLILRRFGMGLESLKHLDRFHPSLMLCNIESRRMGYGLKEDEESQIEGWTQILTRTLKDESSGPAYYGNDPIKPMGYVVHDDWIKDVNAMSQAHKEGDDTGEHGKSPSDALGDDKKPKHLDFTNPEAIWVSRYLTTDQKLDALYDLSSKYARPSDPDISHAQYPPFCIDYVSKFQSYFRFDHGARSTWFKRIMSIDRPSAETAKHAQKDMKQSENWQVSTNKKRKIRDGKQQDIGSLLGGFGH
ncbi:hypothetical protein K469DRAFT_644456 [Zopfia rhizophila CBS 207.26]|uniref:Uncharacterized protein n=1 Tax=Zopfia rhizophila CBS 207.26 TaxID=1314779 RepID=A0A6A6DG88_9PEZI|nr:hypothetical protein K469DRAFT_644456 [Zopfia rhizophila CBS 207.26]